MRPSQRISVAIPKIKDSVFDSDFAITCTVTEQAVQIWLHGIVGDEYTSTDSSTIGQVLAKNRTKPLEMFVNSPGGLAYDGVAIYNAIQSHGAKTTAIIEGLAGSAASLAVTACDNVMAYETAKFHPHYSLCVAMGHKADIQDTLIQMEKLDADLESIYATKTGLPIETIKQHLTGPHGDGTHFTAQEAKAVGYVDEIIQPKAKQKHRAELPIQCSSVALRNRVQAQKLRELDADRNNGKAMLPLPRHD